MSCYSFYITKSVPKWRCYILKGEVNLQSEAWNNFCHTFRQRFTQVWLFSLAQRTWMRKLLSTAVEQRGEKWNSAPSFPLYGYSDQRELENKGLRTAHFQFLLTQKPVVLYWMVYVINSYDSYCSTVVWKSIDLEKQLLQNTCSLCEESEHI